MTNFSGVWVPLVTPFRNGEVDYVSAKRLAIHMTDMGVEGLVVCGTTGEAASLNLAEKVLLLRAVIKAVGGRCSVLAGLSGSNTQDVAADAWAFEDTGIEGFLMSAPCYVRPSQAGIIEHFRHIAKITDLPIIIYNIPSRTGVNIDIETINTLCKSSQFVAIKECGGLAQLTALAANSPCNILCGDDALLLTALKHGAYGAISASAHIHPEEFVVMVKLAQWGKFDEASIIFNRLLPTINILFSEPNPAPVKAALAIQGWIKDELRLPMLPASTACKQRLAGLLNNTEIVVH